MPVKFGRESNDKVVLVIIRHHHMETYGAVDAFIHVF
jgi:hypothetical protein